MQARSCLGLTGIITHHGMCFTGLELGTGSHIVPYFKENNYPGSKLGRQSIRELTITFEKDSYVMI